MNVLNNCRVSLLLAFVVGCISQDVFSEELLTGWLTPHHLLVHLRFDQGSTASRLHTSFPHAIQHLSATLPLRDVELSLTSGRWRYMEWGWPLVPAKPVGAVLDATFHSGLDAAALTAHWAALVNALSGLSCASLGLLHDPASVSRGRIRLRDLVAGAANGSSADGAERTRGQRLHAMLPHEPLCTENLTPWLRLLPCRDQAGLASLLRHRPTVLGAEYVSLDLLLERRTSAWVRQGVRLVQTFTVVLRTSGPPVARRAASNLDVTAPGPDLESILSARVDHFCPAALRSEALVTEPLAWVPAVSELEGPGGACSSLVAAGPGGSSCPAEASAAFAAARDGSLLLLPVGVAGGAPQLDLAMGDLSPGLPRLRRYDTLELLEASGRALGLRLPSPPRQDQPAVQGRGNGGSGSGSGRRADRTGAPGPPELAALGADLLVDRYVTGAGLLRGGMVLRVQRSAELRARLAAGRGSGACGGGLCTLSVLCLHQQFPWYVRPWLHTLALQYDGQVVLLRPHLLAQQVRPAVARASPGVLDLCLRVPPDVSDVQLRVSFSKAFLNAFEYPPDAHRGFDVPAAAVSFLDPLHEPQVQWRVAAADPGVEGVRDGRESRAEEQLLTSPLLSVLAQGPEQQVYTSGLLVPLAAPDFSMPYNVICLSSTVFAVYFGAVLNLLTRRGRDAAAVAATSVSGKVAQMVALAVLFGAPALYLDAGLRAQAEALLKGLGVPMGA